MNQGWLAIFDQQVTEKGAAAVARELGISPAAVSLVKSRKYGASTANIERKVIAIYGGDAGLVACPVLGPILPAVCARHWRCARKIGLRGTNPRTLQLYKTCINCQLRR